MSRTDSDRVRAAASSMASGRPSRAATDLLHRGPDTGVEHEPGPPLPGTLLEQHHGLSVTQRRQHVLVLLGQTEGHLARGQHREPGRHREERLDQLGHRTHQVLAVVQEQDGVGADEPVVQGRHPADDAEGLGHGVGQVGRGSDPVETDQPDATWGRIKPVRDLQREPGLADAGRTQDRHQATGGEGGHDLCHVAVAADRGADQWRQVARRGRPPGATGPQLGALLQDLLLQPSQIRPGRNPELVVEESPHPLISGERIGLPPGPVERGDHGRPQALAQRVLHEQGLQLCHDLAAGTQIHPPREDPLGQGQPNLLEAGAVRREPVPELGQHVPAEQRETSPRCGERGRRILRRGGGGARRRQPAQLGGVDGRRRQGESVAVTLADHQLPPDGPTQLGHLRLQRVAGRRLAPQVLDQGVDPDGAPHVQRQPGQQLGRLARRHRQRHTVPARFDRSEHPDGEHGSERMPGSPLRQPPSACRQPSAGR